MKLKDLPEGKKFKSSRLLGTFLKLKTYNFTCFFDNLSRRKVSSAGRDISLPNVVDLEEGILLSFSDNHEVEEINA